MKTARNLGWDEVNQAWKFKIVGTKETFHVDIYAIRPGYYEIAGRTYIKG